MSVAPPTVGNMTSVDIYRQAAGVLAALELVPGDPGDLSGLLRDESSRALLFGGLSSIKGRGVPGDLATYLYENLDLGRVEHWSKVLDRGSGEYRPLIIGTDEYPRRLSAVPDAPPILFRSVTDSDASLPTSLVDGPALSIVGGRNTSSSVLQATHAVAADVASAGVHVVSGLAAGVDTAAHLGALAGGGTTTAVLGTGIERTYPAENIDLALRIADRGMLLSQFAPTSPRSGTTFLRRNAVIAALTTTSLVMDAGERSGSRHELEQAQRYGRQVLLWEPALGSARWANELVSAGTAHFVSSAEQVHERLK